MGTRTAYVPRPPARLPGQETILSWLLAVLLFLAPLFPDVKLARPKLLLLEAGLYLLLFLFLGMQAYAGKFSLRRSPVFLPLAAYGAFTALYYLLSPDRPVAAGELKRCLLSLTAFFVAANLVRSARVRGRVVAAWLCGSFIAVCYGLLQHTGGLGVLDVPRLDRVMSTFGNPIFFAAHLVIVLPVALGLLLETRNTAGRAALSLFLLAGCIALWHTKTRAAYIAVAAAAIVFLWFAVRSGRKRAGILATGAVLFCLFVLCDPGLWHRQQEHLLIWRDTLVMWAQHPWFGTGPGTFPLYFPQFASDALKTVWPQDRFIVNDAHNEYLQFLSETGIAGLGIFAWVLAAFWSSFRARGGEGEKGKYLDAGLAAAAAAILVQNLFSVDMRFIVSAVSLFLVMGLAEPLGRSFREYPLAPAWRPSACAALVLGALFVFPAVFAPYLARRAVAATPDFFDVKVLEPARTIADLEALAAAYPDQPLVHEKLGWVYAKEKRWPQAIAAYEKAAVFAPGNAGPLNNLGNIYYLLGDRDRAIGYWRRSLAVNPEQVDSRLNLATACYHQGRLKEAAEELQAVLRLQPKNEKALVMLRQMTE